MESFLLNENGSIQQLLTHIVMNYLAQLYCVCVIRNTLDENQLVDINFKLIDAEVKDYPQMIWLKYESIKGTQAYIDDLVRLGINNGCQAFIASPSSVISFLDSFEKVRFSAERRYHLMHVVGLLTNRNETKAYVHRILKHPAIQDIPNILLIAPSFQRNGSSFDLITSRFVSRYNSSDPRILDTFDATTKKLTSNANLFPDKIADLEGRNMRVALFNYKPYAVWKEVPAGTGNANALGSEKYEKTLQIDGTESQLVLTFCKSYNCTVTVSLNEDEWGVIQDNRTGTGVLGAVVERRADIATTSLYAWFHEFEFLEISATVSLSACPCLCPKPRLLSGWILPMRPFSSTMWTVELITFTSIFLTMTLIKLVFKYVDVNSKVRNEYDTTSSFFETWAMFMLQSTNIAFNCMPQMIIGLFTLLSCQLIANAYSGGLASIITVPQYEKPIDTVHELATKNINWGATHEVWVFTIQGSTLPDLMKLVNAFEELSVEELVARTKTRDLCYGIERLLYGHFAVGDYIDENSMKYLRLMRGDLYFGHIIHYFYKTWPFKTVYDLHILHVFESGIQQWWELMTIAKHSDMKVQHLISKSIARDSIRQISLSLDHVSGIFLLWGIGIVGSILAFIIELLHVKLLRRTPATLLWSFKN